MSAIAMLGAGRIAWVHARALQKIGVKIATVFDVNIDGAKQFSATFDCSIAPSADDAITHKDVSAVYICTPTDTHIDMMQRAVQAGKAVFCEKPVDIDYGLVKQCGDDLAGADVPIMMGFNRRFDPTHNAVKKAIVDGDIGTLHNLTIISRDPDLPPLDYVARSGGIFNDMTIHDFDMVRYLLGDDAIVSLYADGGCLIDTAIEQYNDMDSVAVQLKSSEGVQCQIINSRKAVYGYDQRIEAFGSAGMVQSDNIRKHQMRTYTSTHTNAQQPLEDFFLQRYEQSYILQAESFWQAVCEKTDVVTTLHDGVMASYLAHLANQSKAQNKPQNTNITVS